MFHILLSGQFLHLPVYFNKVSAHVFAGSRMLSELALFVFALALEHDDTNFIGIVQGSLSFSMLCLAQERRSIRFSQDS